MARVTFWFRDRTPRAADPVEVLELLLLRGEGDVKPLRPRDPVVLGQAPRIPVSPIFRSAVFTVSGTFEAATYPRRTSTIMSMCSIITGHACMQARQVVHAQISSGVRTSRTKSGTMRFPVVLSTVVADGTRLP